MADRARIRLAAEERARRPRLFASLEAAYPVSFVEGGDAEGEILFGRTAAAAPDGGLPTLVFGESDPSAAPSDVRLTSASQLESFLRGAIVTASARPGGAPAGVALAESAQGVAWSASGEVQYAACAPLETADGELLLARLLRAPDLGTVALLHFVRGTLRAWGLEFPPLRAAFVLDDPNLHRPTYGWADFAELARSAAAHRYHVAVATVPADCWYADPRAVRIFRDNPAQLSLAIHGFQHLRGELGVPATPRAAHAALAGARRLVEGFAHRTGLEVAAVVIPPHGELAQPFIGAMVPHGFEAVVNGGFPGNYDPASVERTGSLGPAHFMPGGVAFIRRDYPFEVTPSYAMLALADVPILLGCHHQDLASGVERFEEIAGAMNGLGEVEWVSLGEVARGNCYRRAAGRTMNVRLLSRAATIAVPPGVDELIVDVLSDDAAKGLETLAIRGPGGNARAVAEGAGCWKATVEDGPWHIGLTRAGATEPVSPARVSAGALARRAACEVRDRLASMRQR